jgi:hypothetical protein
MVQIKLIASDRPGATGVAGGSRLVYVLKKPRIENGDFNFIFNGGSPDRSRPGDTGAILLVFI